MASAELAARAAPGPGGPGRAGRAAAAAGGADRPRTSRVDDLIPIALTYRPELASQQAQVQATLALLKQERLRPLIPSVLLRGYSTPVTGTLAAGYFGGGPDSTIGNGGLRGDLDLQVLWQLDNLGFGNRATRPPARGREPPGGRRPVPHPGPRGGGGGPGLRPGPAGRAAGWTWRRRESGRRWNPPTRTWSRWARRKGVGNQVVLLVRPQEAVAAVQALAQAYDDYYGAVADANRAQFRLYRALGQPAQCLVQDQHVPTLASPRPSPRAAGGARSNPTRLAARPAHERHGAG